MPAGKLPSSRLSPRLWSTETAVNVSGYYGLVRDIRKGLVETAADPNNPYSIALRKVAESYRGFLKQNFIKGRKGKWTKIAKRTQQWRLKKYGLTRKDPLYVTRTLFKLTDKKYNPEKGHFERRTKYGISVGVNRTVGHPDYPGTLFKLVELHAKGRRKIKGKQAPLPKRKIIIPPNKATRDEMATYLRIAHNRALQKANKAVK